MVAPQLVEFGAAGTEGASGKSVEEPDWPGAPLWLRVTYGRYAVGGWPPTI
jgi:hypothetical protein